MPIPRLDLGLILRVRCHVAVRDGMAVVRIRFMDVLRRDGAD